MRIVGCVPFEYGTAIGSGALFLSDVWHHSLPLQTAGEEVVKFAAFFKPADPKLLAMMMDERRVADKIDMNAIERAKQQV